MSDTKSFTTFSDDIPCRFRLLKGDDDPEGSLLSSSLQALYWILLIVAGVDLRFIADNPDSKGNIFGDFEKLRSLQSKRVDSIDHSASSSSSTTTRKHNEIWSEC